jgi:predicted O-methyltransferase YrrM
VAARAFLLAAGELRSRDGSAKLLLFQLRDQMAQKIGKTIPADWQDFRESNLEFSTDWFSMRAANWDRVVVPLLLSRQSPRILEIGSWEGLSACFLAFRIPQAEITCVDTWEGSDEHEGVHNIAAVEKRFNSNVSQFQGAIVKRKESSSDFLKSNTIKFDLIYIDGSHHFSDVLSDAFMAFSALSSGGLLVFDDYLWEDYENPLHNPGRAINIFYRHFGRQLKVLSVGHQVFLVKR